MQYILLNELRGYYYKGNTICCWNMNMHDESTYYFGYQGRLKTIKPSYISFNEGVSPRSSRVSIFLSPYGESKGIKLEYRATWCGWGQWDSGPSYPWGSTPPNPSVPLFSSIFFSSTPAQNSDFCPTQAHLTPTRCPFFVKSHIPPSPWPLGSRPLG